MSRARPSARNLTLTEELERLEQSITLTLQEIDHNFSKAHRIVTASILPLVERYGEHSRSAWEASRFWKQFFEASANVSLSGYEELAKDGEVTAMAGEEETRAQEDGTCAHYTPRSRSGHVEDTTVSVDQTSSTYQDSPRRAPEVSDLTDNGGDLTGSTPRPSSKKLPFRPQFAPGLDSPYESMKRELKRASAGANSSEKETEEAEGSEGSEGSESGENSEDNEDNEDTGMLRQQRTARLPDMSMTPRASLEPSESTELETRRTNRDPLLHRMLDKNYRVLATPHKGPTTVSPLKWTVKNRAPTHERERERKEKHLWEDSPVSSPEMAVPQLRSAAFMSPVRPTYRGRQPAAAGPRTPGVSVQTPATSRKTRDVYAAGAAREATQAMTTGKYADELGWDSDSDEGAFAGMSPPKTIQFALPPSKLMQTPAREASKRIVDEILLTAGVGPEESSEYSPTVVKMNPNILDDTF